MFCSLSSPARALTGGVPASDPGVPDAAVGVLTVNYADTTGETPPVNEAGGVATCHGAWIGPHQN